MRFVPPGSCATIPGDYLSTLNDPAYKKLIQEMERNARQRAARQFAGQLTKQEQRDYELMASLNPGTGDADLT